MPEGERTTGCDKLNFFVKNSITHFESAQFQHFFVFSSQRVKRQPTQKSMTLKDRAAKYFTEFFGTFFLVFTVSCAVLTTTDTSPNTLIPLGVGAALMVAIYAGGYISGAHYNPAVSMACYVRGALGLVDFFAYVGIQVLAGFLANLVRVVAFNLFFFFFPCVVLPGARDVRSNSRDVVDCVRYDKEDFCAG